MNLHFKPVIALFCAAFMTFVASAESPEQLINEMKAKYAPDTRVAVWKVEAKNQNGLVELVGETDNAGAKKELLKEFKKAGIKYDDKIAVLPSEKIGEDKWAVVTISVACLRYDPRNAAELASQAIMGTPMKVLDKVSDFYRVQTPDNYIGYMTAGSLELMTEKEFSDWKTSKRYVVTAYQATLFANPDGDEGNVVSDLVLGNILEFKSAKGNFVELSLPDGLTGYARVQDVAEFSDWANQDFNFELIRKTAFRMMGTPYLWGGTSVKSIDCSGFVKTSYFANGIILQRDASQQALTGLKYECKDWAEKAQPGDLIFIGNKNGRVTHVAMYLNDGKFIHSSGRVKLNSMNPKDDNFIDYTYLSMSRINGEIGTKGIVKVKEHPWYF